MTPEALGNTHSEVGSGPKTYGQTVREGRKLVGLSQEKLADQAELSQGYLSQIEHDEVKDPSFAVRTRIAVVLGFKIDDTEATENGDVIFLEPHAAYLQKIMLELAPEQKDLLMAYIKLTFPQASLEQASYLSMPQPLSGPELGAKIQDERVKREWSQGQLANRASLSQGYLSQLENGDVKSPSLSVVDRISTALEMDIKDLAGVTTMKVPGEIASVDQFLRDENVTQDVKDAKLKSLMNFLEIIGDPVFQDNFIILPRNQQDTSTPAQ
ncbi:hypothetical protein A3D07_00890 [Candidatus Curtissbacteria bacterium RIFCSPHIGHO2_02_FULL_42_15]|uniref:HTH cro/C1-type domain-containing protein n=1 Tax=Candidatus Curtissbacteria bacterium RIFCSPHIGHO2_02_FULL_42_15 TaxID=1797716 RepID=A0A1F5GEX7_9BACT|nr:MAG: hypothetical protein A3D07_00890 [Candidatus Curtissbacteria bacterium RIFCSPHIGHO2_02_FULL_42_15]